ncbi:MAG: lipid-A-disaccharide synthase [Flavobacteriales bacterium]
MNYYLIAGEASGDLHGSNLMKALQEQDPEASFRCWGGDRMEKAGGTLVRHYRETAFMGFLEVLTHLRSILGFLRECKRDLLAVRPDALILIDYPGFNLRIAEFAHQHSIPVFYYISPQVWAWKKKRVHRLGRYADRIFVILPFEKAFYERFGYEVEFVGHPLLDAIDDERKALPDRSGLLEELGASERPILALLPGSREQEVERMLPVMLALKEDFPEHLFVIAATSSLEEGSYKEALDRKGVVVLKDRSYAVLEHAEAALVTSGTATLEAALFEVPLVVCYSGGSLSFWIAKRLVNVPHISLVNLIMEKEVVKELIQGELDPERLRAELEKILPGGRSRDRMLAELQELREKLGGPGASGYTAERILKTMQDGSC